VVFAIVFAIRAFARDAQSYHVFAGGFVHCKNKHSTAYAWNEIAELTPFRQRAGQDRSKLLHYRLVPRGGRPIAIPLVIVEGRDSFMDNLMGMLDHNGVPVS